MADIYSVQTTGGSIGTATLVKAYADVDGQFAPNGFAYDGSTYYYTSFGVDPTTWYRNGAAVPGNLPGPASTGEVAGADTYGGQYVYANSDGSMYTIPTGAANAGSATALTTGLGGAAGFGDMAFDPATGRLYASYNTIGLIEIDTTTGAPIGSAISKQGSDGGGVDTGKYAGLGFDVMTGVLYGVTGGSGVTSKLWELDITGTIDAAMVGSVALAGGTAVVVTDAASPVPIPGAVWLFGSGVLGLLGIGYTRRRRAAA